jgi:hypothetical protein
MFSSTDADGWVVFLLARALTAVVGFARAIAFPEKAMAAAVQFKCALHCDATAAGEAA